MRLPLLCSLYRPRGWIRRGRVPATYHSAVCFLLLPLPPLSVISCLFVTILRSNLYYWVTDEAMVGFNNNAPLLSEPFNLEDFFPDDPPPAPARGDPLLTSAERDGLNSTLAQMTSENYGEQNFGEGLPTGDWLAVNGSMPPPNLLSLGTAFGIPQDLSGLQGNGFFPNIPPQNFATSNPPPVAFGLPSNPVTFATSASLMSATSPITTTAPSFIAPGAIAQLSPPHHHQHHHEQPIAESHAFQAAALLPNGVHHRSHSLQSEPSVPSGPHHRPNNSMGPPVGHLRHQPLSEFKQTSRRMSESTDEANQINTWGTWIFGDNRLARQSQPSPPNVPDLQYGTDQQFSNNNQPFVPQNEKDSSESMANDQLRYMKAVELSHSADNTRAPSPVFNGDGFNLKTRGPPKALNLEPSGHDAGRFRKSRSGDGDLDDEDEPQSAVSKASSRKRKPKGDGTDSPGADGLGSGKRRKSSAAVRRDNLTEEQKRSNHINSEKKRRKVIQVGFENLGVIVPGLTSGGNPSKSAMLETSVTFLQDLLQGNTRLRQQLAQMEQMGQMGPV